MATHIAEKPCVLIVHLTPNELVPKSRKAGYAIRKDVIPQIMAEPPLECVAHFLSGHTSTQAGIGLIERIFQLKRLKDEPSSHLRDLRSIQRLNDERQQPKVRVAINNGLAC